MKIVAERDVPERVRLMHPIPREPEQAPAPPPDRLPDILQALVELLKKEAPAPRAIDLTPLVEAIRAMPQPAQAPAPTKSWVFNVKRGAYREITEIIATRKG
jgi:hypothetical protein